MKRLIIALSLYATVMHGQILAPILFNQPASGASGINTTPVQTVNDGTFVNHQNITVSTAHHLLVAFVLNDNGTGEMSGAGCSDGTNTWQIAVSQAGSFYSTGIAYAMDVATGTFTVTCTVSGTSTISVVLKEFSGASLVAALDDTDSTVNSTSGGTVTTALSGELLAVAFLGNDTQTCTGYTQNFAATLNNKQEVNHVAATAAGNYTAASCASTSLFAVSTMAAFK